LEFRLQAVCFLPPEEEISLLDCFNWNTKLNKLVFQGAVLMNLRFSRWVWAIFLAMTGFSTNAQVSEQKIKRLIDEMKSDNEQLTRVASMELASLGEEALAAIDTMVRAPGDHEKEWEAYKEIVGKIRKSTKVTIHQENGNAADLMKEMTRQTGIGVFGVSQATERQLTRQELNLDTQGVLFWEVMDSIGQRMSLGMSLDPAGDVILSPPNFTSPSSMLCGDWVYLYTIDRTQHMEYADPNRIDTTLKLQMRLLTDPKRIGYLSKGEYRIDKAEDDQGNKYVPVDMSGMGALESPSVGATSSTIRSFISARNDFNGTATLTTIGKPGTKLSIRGAAILYGGEIETKKLELANLKPQDLEMGAGLITITNVDMEKEPTIVLQISPDKWNLKSDASFPQLILELFRGGGIYAEDEKGVTRLLRFTGMIFQREVARITLKITQEAMRGGPSKPFGKPASFVFMLPMELKPVSIPFELKDIPIP
jgi:hypothetical protein